MEGLSIVYGVNYMLLNLESFIEFPATLFLERKYIFGMKYIST
jgi:hypothetical protein